MYVCRRCLKTVTEVLTTRKAINFADARRRVLKSYREWLRAVCEQACEDEKRDRY